MSRLGVDNGEYWRILTAGFLHTGFLHLLFNMFGLYILGGLLEPAIGRLRFGIIYFVSLLAGSFGALLLEPTAPTVGASGAIFGLMGAAVVVMRNRGINPMESGLGPVDRPEPADHLHDPEHLDRRPHRRPGRRRAGRVRSCSTCATARGCRRCWRRSWPGLGVRVWAIAVSAPSGLPPRELDVAPVSAAPAGAAWLRARGEPYGRGHV